MKVSKELHKNIDQAERHWRGEKFIFYNLCALEGQKNAS